MAKYRVRLYTGKIVETFGDFSSALNYVKMYDMEATIIKVKKWNSHKKGRNYHG